MSCEVRDLVEANRHAVGQALMVFELEIFAGAAHTDAREKALTAAGETYATELAHLLWEEE